MGFYPPPPTDMPGYSAVLPITSLLSGGPAARANMTGISDSDGYGLDVTNATGDHLRAGANILLVTNGGVNVTAFTSSGAAQVGTDLNVLGNTVLGNAGTDTVTLTAATTANGTFSTTAATNLGNGNADAITVIGVSTFRNAASSNTQMVVDAGNGRVQVGSGTALSGATSSVLEVTGLTYLTPASAGEVALNIWRSTAAGSGWGVGVTSTDQLKFTDNGGQGIVTIGDTSSTYQLEVTGDLHVTDDTEMTGDLLGTAGVFDWQNSGNSRLKIDSTGVGFFGSATVAKPTVVGAKGGNVALANLMSALANLGLVTDSTT